MESQPAVAVAAGDANEDRQRHARELSARLDLPLVSPTQDERSRTPFLLIVGDRGLALCPRDDQRSAVRVDFVRGPTAYRRESARKRNQLLARAVRLKGTSTTVLDATAGLGQDAFLLACLGCRVTAVERSDVLAALLRDGLDRAVQSGSVAITEIATRINLIESDSRDVLKELTPDGYPDVVYIDPMYPEGRKSALAKKEMRICRELVGDDEDAADLCAAAQSLHIRRVVVKRHRHAPPLSPDPSVSYRGRTVRYDAYDRSAISD